MLFTERLDLAIFKAVHCWHLLVLDAGIWEERAAPSIFISDD